MSTLQLQLESLPVDALERINRPGGLEIVDLFDFLLKPRDYTVHMPEAFDETKLVDYHGNGHFLADAGAESFKEGTTAFCILAGGSGTRIGSTKGLLKIPNSDMTLLGLKLLQAKDVKHVWIMTSPENHDQVDLCVRSTGRDQVSLFTQYESIRLTPDNQVSLLNGSPEFHPCGHGDLIPALKRSGILKSFLDGGGKRVMVVNVDNVLGAPSAELVGWHMTAKKPITCEVVKRNPEEGGGYLCNHAGIDQIVERFRMSSHTDLNQFDWVNTNTMIFDADLDFESIKWSWHRVKKIVDRRAVVQYERLLQDLTSNFQTQFVASPRNERYMPVKTDEDLQSVAQLFGKK